MEQSTFFKTLYEKISGLGAVVITVSAHDANQMSISVLPRPKAGVKDEALKTVSPLIISGSVEEIDEKFFELISKPVTVSKELYVSVAQFEKSAEEARKNSDMERDKERKKSEAQNKLKKEKEANDKKATESIKELKEALEKKDFGLANKAHDKLSKLTEDKHTEKTWKEIGSALEKAKSLLVSPGLF